MARQDILNEVEQAFGFIPDYYNEAPDAILEQWWTLLGWVLSDGALSSQQKALVAYGAATAIHCEY